MLTTAAALQKLGADFRIKTSVYSGENGSLYVAGRGDPSIAEAQLKSLAQQLKQRGISQVNQLIGDDSYFRGSAAIRIGKGRRASWLRRPINSLIQSKRDRPSIVPPGDRATSEVTFAEPKLANQWQLQNNSVTVAQNESEFIEVGRELDRPIIRVSGQLKVGGDLNQLMSQFSTPLIIFCSIFNKPWQQREFLLNRL